MRAAVTPPRIGSLKRPGEELVSDRDRSPGPSHHGSPMLNRPSGGGPGGGGWLSPAMSNHLLSPRPGGGGGGGAGPGSRPTTPDHLHVQQQPLPMHPHSPVQQYSVPRQPSPQPQSQSQPPQLQEAYYGPSGPDGIDATDPRGPSRSHHNSPMLSATPNPNNWALSPSMSNQHLSPRVGNGTRSTTPSNEEKPVSNSLRHPPLESASGAQTSQPDLLRTSQIPAGPQTTSYGATYATYSNKAILKLTSDLNLMAMGWSNEEWTNRRRLIQFFRHQEGNVINASFRPIGQNEFVPNSIVISCIFRDEWNECFVTSVDTIYLLEALVGVRFTVEEKNRIRRNLEGFKPMTVSKSKADSEPFFKLIMGFPNPKPRNIEKDVKVFPWKVLSNALKKIIGKYSATYPAPVDTTPSVHVATPSDFSSDLPHSQAPQPMASTSTAPNSPSLVENGGGRFASHPHSPAPNLQTSRFPGSPGPSGDRYGGSQPGSPAVDGGRFIRQPSPIPPSPLVGGGNEAPSPMYQAPAQQLYASTSTLPPHSPHLGNGSGPSNSGRRDFDYQNLDPAVRSSSYVPASPNPSHISHPHSPNPSTSQAPPQASYIQQSQEPPLIHPQHQYMPQGQQFYNAPAGGLFPSAEDYGVPNSRTSSLVPPPLNHTRSYSEGPRRSPALGASPVIGAPGGWISEGGGNNFLAGSSYPAAEYYGGGGAPGAIPDWNGGGGQRGEDREAWSRQQSQLKQGGPEWEEENGSNSLIEDGQSVGRQ